MLKVWIVGANGQIGHALNNVLDPLEMEVLNTDLDELDITDTDNVLSFGSVNRPDVIINCAGITDTEECEKNPEHAYRVNALGARNLSIVARKCGAKIARMIIYLIGTNEYGTYHVTCSGVCNRYEFAQEVLRLAGKNTTLKSVPTEQSDLSSVRPTYAVLDNFILRIIEVYDMPDWKESLKAYMDERKED